MRRGHGRPLGTVDIALNNTTIYGDASGAITVPSTCERCSTSTSTARSLIAHGVAPHMVQQRWGRIVNIASIAANLHQLAAARPTPSSSSSARARHAGVEVGVLRLTRRMAGQLGQFNVTVSCLAQGSWMTEATERQVRGNYHPMFRVDVVHAPTPTPSTWSARGLLQHPPTPISSTGR